MREIKKMKNNPMIYFNGDFIRKKEVRLSPDDRDFVFSDGVYEVIKAYKERLFQFNAHLERVKKSLKSVRINFDDVDALESHCDFLTKLNSLEKDDFAVYLQITRGAAIRTHCFPDEKVSPTVYMKAFPCTSRMEEQENGVKVILLEDIRC
jgi:D-alanine transaminase